jgi:hypothetical protein
MRQPRVGMLESGFLHIAAPQPLQFIGLIYTSLHIIVSVETNNNKHSLRSNTKGYGGKTYYTDSQNSDVLQTVCRKLWEDSGTGGFGLGAPFSWLEKPRNRMGRDLDCMADVLMGFHRSR